MKTIVDTGDGADSLWLNQLYSIASGGDFWESGGGLSTAGSSTSIEMSLSAVTVNVGGETVTHGSQPVSLTPTSGEYRTDVIYATSTGVEVQEGQEMDKLPQGNQFPSIWQPTPDNGSLIGGVPLWCVHITPNDAASADIGSWQWQDRRMNAENINSDAVVSLLESYGKEVSIDISGAAQTSTNFAGIGVTSFRRQNGLYISTTADGTQSRDHMHVPQGETLRVWRMGVVDANDASPAGALASIYDVSSGGSTERILSLNGVKSKDYEQEFSGPLTVDFRCEDNSGGAADQPTAHFVVSFEKE